MSIIAGLNRWQGKVALVTEACCGTGLEICKTLARRGLIVIGLVSTADQIEILRQNFVNSGLTRDQIDPIVCDLLPQNKTESNILAVINEIKSRYDTLNILINNAGLTYTKLLMHGKADAFNAMLTINVLTLSVFSNEAAKLMIGDEGSRNAEQPVDAQIININNVLGHAVTNDSHFYSAIKNTVHALTKDISQELRQLNNGIRVSQISAGAVDGVEQYRFKAHDTVDMRIVNAVVNILEQPPDVEICDVVIRATKQQF